MQNRHQYVKWNPAPEGHLAAALLFQQSLDLYNAQLRTHKVEAIFLGGFALAELFHHLLATRDHKQLDTFWRVNMLDEFSFSVASDVATLDVLLTVTMRADLPRFIRELAIANAVEYIKRGPLLKTFNAAAESYTPKSGEAFLAPRFDSVKSGADFIENHLRIDSWQIPTDWCSRLVWGHETAALPEKRADTLVTYKTARPTLLLLRTLEFLRREIKLATGSRSQNHKDRAFEQLRRLRCLLSIIDVANFKLNGLEDTDPLLLTDGDLLVAYGDTDGVHQYLTPEFAAEEAAWQVQRQGKNRSWTVEDLTRSNLDAFASLDRLLHSAALSRRSAVSLPSAQATRYSPSRTVLSLSQRPETTPFKIRSRRQLSFDW